MVVLVSLWSSKRRLIWYVAVGTSLLTIVGFFASPAGGELWKVLCNRFLALLAIWTTAVLSAQRQAIQDEKAKAISDLRILRGLLPICAQCKKIRNDQGSWDQMELYIRDNSEADFSRGYCTECGAKALEEIEQRAVENKSSRRT